MRNERTSESHVYRIVLWNNSHSIIQQCAQWSHPARGALSHRESRTLIFNAELCEIKLEPRLDFVVWSAALMENKEESLATAKRTGYFAITRARYRLASILSDKQVDSQPSQKPLLWIIQFQGCFWWKTCQSKTEKLHLYKCQCVSTLIRIQQDEQIFYLMRISRVLRAAIIPIRSSFTARVYIR